MLCTNGTTHHAISNPQHDNEELRNVTIQIQEWMNDIWKAVYPKLFMDHHSVPMCQFEIYLEQIRETRTVLERKVGKDIMYSSTRAAKSMKIGDELNILESHLETIITMHRIGAVCLS